MRSGLPDMSVYLEAMVSAIVDSELVYGLELLIVCVCVVCSGR